MIVNFKNFPFCNGPHGGSFDINNIWDDVSVYQQTTNSKVKYVEVVESEINDYVCVDNFA